MFVTGGSGFLGNWLISALLNKGARVTALMRPAVKDKRFFLSDLNGRVTIQPGTVQDRDVIEQALREHNIQTVLHLAAQALVGTANRDPVTTFATNIAGTWNVLEACRQNACVQEVLITSSDKVYGHHATLPYREDFPLLARYPYDVSKSCAEQIGFTYFNTYQLPVVIARCANIFGPGDTNFSRIIPGTIRSALLGQNPIIRSDGSPLRDYIYVEDIVWGLTTLIEQAHRPEVRGQAFNFGSGEPKSVLELTQLILQHTDRLHLYPQIKNETKDEVQHHYPSIRRAQQILGWKPQAPVSDRILEVIKWYQSHLQAVET